MRTGLPGRVEHFIAYAGSASIAMVGYGQRWGTAPIVGSFRIYAGILKHLRHFLPGRQPSLAVSALGAFFGGLFAARLGRGVLKGTHLDIA